MKTLKNKFKEIEIKAAERGFLTPPEKRELEGLDGEAQAIQDDAISAGNSNEFDTAFNLRMAIAELIGSEMAIFA